MVGQLENLKQQDDEHDSDQHHNQEPLALKKITHSFHIDKSNKTLCLCDIKAKTEPRIKFIDYQIVTI